MGLYARKPKSDLEPIPAKTWQAVCYALYDIGTQDTVFNGKPGKKRQCFIFWELQDCRMEKTDEGGNPISLPRVVSKKYTLSSHKKSNLRKDIESWRGISFDGNDMEEYDLELMIGANCLLQIIHNESGGTVYGNVGSIMPLMDGMEKKVPENKTGFYDIEAGKPIPENCYEWVREKIMKSAERTESGNPADLVEQAFGPPPEEEDIPF